ncbi:MAG: recombinase-like helix-turn-helix domain-containing protein [Motiliproteus sp.]
MKVTISRKSDHSNEETVDTAYIDELKHLIHGYQKKGDNLKLMVQKLNEHGHPQADGNPWCYESLQTEIKKLGL